MTPALEIKGMVKRYPRQGLLQRGWAAEAAVNGVDLCVEIGEVVGIIGESGSGNTTLVRAAWGLLPFQEGQVRVLGQDLSALSARDLRKARRHFQLLFQDPTAMLNPGLTVRQHLLESAQVHERENQVAVVIEMAERVGLSHRLDALPGQLSGGEQRRVGLARVLVPEPALLVADEPTAGLDAALKADLIDAIVKHRSPESAVLLISHDLAMVAYACDRIVVMLNGQVVDRFITSELKSAKHHPYTLQLLQAAGILEQAEALECARESS
jgi:oligopeptide transport system ATP-binding protein